MDLYTEMEQVRAFICMEKLRGLPITFEENLEVLVLPLPVYTMIPIVKNAIRYGLKEEEEQQIVRIESVFDEDHNKNHILIRNRGRDFSLEKALAEGKSLSLVSENLKILHEELHKEYENGWVTMDICIPDHEEKGELDL